MLKPDTYLIHHKPSSISSNDSPITSTSKILAHKRSCILPAITTTTPGVLSFHTTTTPYGDNLSTTLLDKPTIQVNLRSSSSAKESFAAHFFTEMGNSDVGLSGSTILPSGDKAPENGVSNRNTNKDFLHVTMMDYLLKISSMMSMVSVCLHTPQTLEIYPKLWYIIIILDSFVTTIFTIEALLLIKQSSSSKILSTTINPSNEVNKKKKYFTTKWRIFDFSLLLCHYISIFIDILWFIKNKFPNSGIIYRNWYSVLRSPRPFIMIRFIREIISFKLPKNRIQQIIKRSSQQIQNVTIFFLFFMALYAIMGVQFFGRMEYHCVLPGTDPLNVTISDLAIPDTMCSMESGGYQCPPNLVCMKLQMNSHRQGFYGMFNDFASSLFTVYMAASQEGWVYVLYDCLDTFPSYIAFFYFVTLIFFLAWLVKNVFIAVITETFAEIRVQFSEMWSTREKQSEDSYTQKLEKTGSGKWKLIENSDLTLHDSPCLMYKIVRSTYFQICIMALVLLNSLINASFVHYHDESDAKRKIIYYYIEVFFTILFNIEFLLKVYALSWNGFVSRGQHKFEFILVIGSTFNVFPMLYGTNFFTYFQVFRLLRLIKASPMLEDFVYKIFGPGKKLGGLVIFTMVVLILTSAISLQLFCYVPKLDKFRTFPQAFMSMFQIITQEGWTDVVVEILRSTNESFVVFVAAYFVGYHLFVTLIVLSLFVAVILDNLEMDEELKKIKQLKAREETTCMRTTLPLRLRVFEKFPTRPQMVSLKKASNEFPLPKIRDSFTRSFADEEIITGNEDIEETWIGKSVKLLKCMGKIRSSVACKVKMRQIGSVTKKTGLLQLLDSSNKSRMILSDSNQFLTGTKTLKSDINSGKGKKTYGVGGHSLKINQIYEAMKENGDCRPTDSAPKNNLKQGEIDIRALQQKRAQAEFTRNRIEEEMRENHPFFDCPLFTIGRDSKLRQLCKKIVYAKYNSNQIDSLSGKPTTIRYKQFYAFISLMTYLDWFMVIVTSFSCYSMLFESPWPTTGENLIFNNPYLQVTEYIFILSMTIELGLKIIANGLFFTPNAVVRDVGGVMTLFIYITSLWYLLWMPHHVEINSFSQLLMIFRALRPLRIYTLVPHIRRVVVELCKGFKEILLVTILLVLLMFIFASFGVQIVGGKLAACNDQTIKTRENCTGVFWQKVFVTRMEVHGKDSEDLHPKILVPRVWTNPRNFNFDHIGNAMLALFETLSYKGWNVIRDIVGTRQGPWAVLFIHIYVFIGCMIGLTLFVGVVIANYMENRGTALLTVDQRRWHDLKARLRMAQPLHVPPKPAESARLRRRFYEWTMIKGFKQFFVILVLINSATLVIPWNVDEEESQMNILYLTTTISAVCNILFTVEVILKIIAYTLKGFWQSRRNKVDLIITICGLVWIIIHFMMATPAAKLSQKTYLKHWTYSFGYIVAIARFFSIVGRKSTLKMLMLTVVMSMVRSLFIIAAMFLLVLFYAYTGVILFGMVKYGQAISKHVNFRSGKEALVVLFRCVTGEDWNDIMHDSQIWDFCYWRSGDDFWKSDCGNYYGAIIYFCSFYLIITYIVLNLLVAVIMENFSLFYSSEEDALLSYADIRNYQQVWNMIDVEQRGSIPVKRIKFLLRLLKGRLEVDTNKDRLLFKHMCYEMEKIHNGEDVTFHDILYMLSYRSVDIRKSLQLEELLQREELEYIITEDVAKRTIREWLEGCLRKSKQISSSTENPLIAQMRSTLIPQSSIGLQSTITPTSLSPSINSDLSTIINDNSIINDKLQSKGGVNLAFDDTIFSESSFITGPRLSLDRIKAPNILLQPRRSTFQNQLRRQKSKKRRSSIPELMGEAKKIVLGNVAGRMKSLSIHSTAQPSSSSTLLIDTNDGNRSSLIETPIDYSSNVNISADNLATYTNQSSNIYTNIKNKNLPPLKHHYQIVMNLPIQSTSQNTSLSQHPVILSEALTEVEENSEEGLDEIITNKPRKDSLDVPNITYKPSIKTNKLNMDDETITTTSSQGKDLNNLFLEDQIDPEEIKNWWVKFSRDDDMIEDNIHNIKNNGF
uniref:Ion transport domain-containing protein n=1 Tax=Strongyloides stercoralis TaxID=6248 RepID=A0A0K0EDN0_STRER